MPKFLENKLKAEYPNNPGAVYGTMNKIGAMHGNKETAKGREMERKHEDKMAKMGKVGKMKEMRIEIHRGTGGKVSGFTVHHHMHSTPASKSGAFMENETVSQPFGAHEHEAMIDHVHEHTGAQLGAAAGNAKEEKAENEPEGGGGGEYEES